RRVDVGALVQLVLHVPERGLALREHGADLTHAIALLRHALELLRLLAEQLVAADAPLTGPCRLVARPEVRDRLPVARVELLDVRFRIAVQGGLGLALLRELLIGLVVVGARADQGYEQREQYPGHRPAMASSVLHRLPPAGARARPRWYRQSGQPAAGSGVGLAPGPGALVAQEGLALVAGGETALRA